MKIAVFDVCGTLYDSNTTFDFLDDYFSKDKKYRLFRKFSKSLVAKVLNYPFYKFFYYDIIRIIATGFLKNIPKETVDSAMNEFVFEKLESKIKNDIYTLLTEYKKKGFTIILMSGSYSSIIKNVNQYFQTDGYFASELEVLNDKYTGKFMSDQLFNKKEVLLEMYPNITELIVLSDNLTDYELMKEADYGYAICKKPKQVAFWKSKNLPHVKIVY